MNVRLATEPQRQYLVKLLDKRTVPADAAVRLQKQIVDSTVTFTDASRAIDWLKARPFAQQQTQIDADEAAMDAAEQEGDRLDAERAVASKAALEDRLGGVGSVRPTLEIGIYEVGDTIYKVKRSRNDRLYAEALIYDVKTAERLTATGAEIKAKYAYAPGAIRFIRPEHRVTAERAEELSIVFTSCIVCGRRLRVAKSVSRGIGPKCIEKV